MKLVEMTAKKEKKNDKVKSKTNPPSELRESRWSVVTFDGCAAKNLNYEQAEQKSLELAAQNMSGLCIVTDEAAEKINER